MNIALIHMNAETKALADVKAGYSDEFLIAELKDFASIAGPVNNGTAGSTKTISSAHTFKTGKGFTEFKGKMGTASGDGESIGEAGGSVMQYKPKLTLTGDGPLQCEFIENLLYKEIMVLAPNPDCDSAAPHTQFGGKCTPAVVSKVTFKSGLKNSGGMKEYEVELQTFDKFFYSATVTKKPAVTPFAPVSAEVENANKGKIFITFNRAIDATNLPAATQFKVTGTVARAIDSGMLVDGGTRLRLSLATEVATGDIVKLTYIKDVPALRAAGDFEEADSFVNLIVTNNVTA